MGFGRAEGHRGRSRTPKRAFPGCLWAEASHGGPVGPCSDLRVKRSANAFPRTAVRSGNVFAALLAYSGGPVPDSHRLPARSLEGSNARRACRRDANDGCGKRQLDSRRMRSVWGHAVPVQRSRMRFVLDSAADMGRLRPVRWWSNLPLKFRQTGNPVRIRNGPRRCNRALTSASFQGPLSRSSDEKDARRRLGSQKTYQRVVPQMSA